MRVGWPVASICNFLSVWPMSMDVSFLTLQAALPGGHWVVLSPVPGTMKPSVIMRSGPKVTNFPPS